MTQPSAALAPCSGARMFVGLAVAFSMFFGGVNPAHATKAEKVTLDEETPSDKPKDEAKSTTASDEAPKVVRVVPPYSLPWQLRPVLPVSLVRSDTSFAFYGVGGSTIVSQLGGSYKIIPRVSAFAKLGIVQNSPPGDAPSTVQGGEPTGANGFNFMNPLLGGTVGLWPVKSLKLGLSLGLTLPVGSGGSESTDNGKKLANLRGMIARSGFDNALFMVDYFSVLPSVDIAWVTHNFTLQGEVNMSFLTKVRGRQQEKSSNTDLSLGMHAGYFFFPFLSAGLDLRYQRWLSTPRFVAEDLSGHSRDLFTIAVGPRFHVELADKVWLRPGASLCFGFDEPMSGSSYKIVQLDLPLVF